jgi:hypothetical protein
MVSFYFYCSIFDVTISSEVFKLGDDEWKNYDENGKFIPRKNIWDEKYTDYYGPVVVDKDGDKAGSFFFKEYADFGHYHIIGELVVYALFALFFVWGAYNIYLIGMELQTRYMAYIVDHPIEYAAAKWLINQNQDQIGVYAKEFLAVILIVVGIIGLVYLFSLAVSFLIVKLFSYLVEVLMYASVFLQIGMLIYSYMTIKWEYNWVFLLLLIPDILMLTFWRKKFKKAIRALKFGSKAVGSIGWHLLGPQIVQTILIGIICLFFTATSISSVLGLVDLEYIFTVGSKTITITEGWVYFGYACLFVFLAFIIYYVSQGMKILMIHHWYRGGGKLGFWRAFKIVRHRWWGLLGYALSSTIIHMLQYFKKMMKGEFGPKNVKEAFSFTGELLPGKEAAFHVKKGTPWYERLWMGLNTFTLQSIIIENKLFHTGIIRSLYIMLRDLAQVYIKETHVKTVLTFLEYVLMTVNVMIGAAIGYALGKYLGFNGYVVYIFTGSGSALFLWIAGTTTTFVIDDVNLGYVTILYILSLDEINKKDGYAIDRLENNDGTPSLVIDGIKRDKISKKQKQQKEKISKKSD